MIKLQIIIAIISLTCFAAKAQNPEANYQYAYEVIDSMLTGKTPLNFKKAVLTTENAYLDGKLDINQINNEINLLVNLSKAIKASNVINYNESDKDEVQTHAAIFKMLTDTIPIILDSSHVFIHTPYDFDDMWGQDDWTKMFLSKLLAKGNGNCHSMPYLYKIIAEELHVPAYIAFAPNHIYIKLRCKKTGWYNTELTSATFPIDAWIMASGYVHLDAVRNGLYMDTLGTRQSIAHCMLNLAQGYQRRVSFDCPDFVVRCCNTTLAYNPVDVNAMLTKSEAQKRFVQSKMKAANATKPEELFTDAAIKATYADMEQTYVRLHQLGYRRMPQEMYLQWMGLLKSQPDKYLDYNQNHKFENQ